MNDFPRLEPAIGYLPARDRQQPRSTSDSPTRQRNTDDLLSQLTPRTAVDAFRNPSGALKRCMDGATHSEQAFAMRAAVASRSIQDWLEELHAWPWPTHDTSAGFERPPAKRRKLFSGKSDPDKVQDSAEGDDAYETRFMGSLLATEIARYERRIAEVSQDLEDIDLEEIKNHVLHNHIMPLSRPGTPMSDSLRSGTLSASTYAHMDDLTAIIASTILQALPNMSRLNGLLNTWTVRLLVLRKSSIFLNALEDAEIALQAGWKAMEIRSNKVSGDAGEGKASVSSGSVLSRQDFETMKLVVERKVSQAGHNLDHMLDALEGREDTLPEDWVDRMDTVEHEYAEWVATCERKIREADWAKMVEDMRAAKGSSLQDMEEETSVTSGLAEEQVSPVQDVLGEVSELAEATREAPLAGNGAITVIKATETVQPQDDRGVRDAVTEVQTKPSAGPASRSSSPPIIKVHPAEEDATGTGEPSHETPVTAATGSDEKSDRSSGATTAVEEPEAIVVEEAMGRFDGLKDTTSPTDAHSLPAAVGQVADETTSSPADLVDGDVSLISPEEQPPVTDDSNAVKEGQLLDETEIFPDDDADLDSDIEFPFDSEVPEPDLPLMPRERRESEISDTSTVLHGPQSGFATFSSSPIDQGTPDYRRLRDFPLPSTEGGDDILPSVEHDDTDLPSSPPDCRSSTRSFSVSFNDIPTVHEVPDDYEGTSPRTPTDLSFAEDATYDDTYLAQEASEVEVSVRSSSSKVSAVSADEHLQRQISEILESIPAKIKLTTEPSAINLNPPDFTMPTRATKPKPDPYPRSYSSMSTRSSRAGTPSFTLAPAYAKNNRPRHQMNQQEIKLYHLSRSNGEAPIKLAIRCVGENGERVMVRVGGGWADLGEYLKEYASHHGRRSGDRVEIRDLPRISTASRAGSSPPSRAGSMPPTRPASAMDMSPSPLTALNIRRARRSTAAEEMTRIMNKQPLPKTPLANTPMVFPPSSTADGNIPSSGESTRSRSSSRLSSAGGDLEADISLGMAGPKGKHVQMTPERLAWVESVKEKVRFASGERVKPPTAAADSKVPLGQMGRVGATKRLFRRGQTPDPRTPGSGK